MGVKKRHHYLSKFYLRGFVDSNDQDGKKNFIWVYEKGRTEIKRISTRNVALGKHFHSFKLPDGSRDSESLENDFMMLEGKVAPVIQKIESKSVLLNDDRSCLAHFIAIMLFKTPNYKKQIQNKVNAEMDHETDSLGDDPIEIAKRLEVLLKHNIAPKDKRVAEFTKVLNSTEFRSNLSDDVWLLQLLETAQRVAKLIHSMKWTILCSRPGLRFVTSDSPVIHFPEGKSPHRAYSSGLKNEATCLTFPLTRSRALIASWEDKKEGYVEGHDSYIKLTNRRTVYAASKYVFTSFKDSAFNTLLVQKFAETSASF